MNAGILVSQGGSEFLDGVVLLPVVRLQHSFETNRRLSASSLSSTDVNTPSSPPPSSGFGLLPDHYADPEQEAKEDRDCPAHRRRLNYLLRRNLWSMFKGNWNCLLDLTVTFPADDGVPLDTLNVQRRLTQIRPHLDRLFVCWFLVLEPDGNGNPHYQGAAVARGNIRRSWNQTAWEKMQRGKSTDGQAITYNRRLVKIWAELRQHIPGRTTATPIMSAKDVVGYITKKLHIPSREWDRFKPGTRWIHCSRSLRKVVASSRFCWNTPRCRLARQKQSVIAAALRVSPERCRQLFDSKMWHWRMTKMIAALDRTSVRWFEADINEVELAIISSLATIDIGWAGDLALKFERCRDCRMRGLNPYEPEPLRDPGDIMREVMEQAAQWRAAALQSLNANNN